jgi:acyl-coenzyme A thioesterase PaaI-like protein
VRALERLIPPGAMLTRLTFDFLRPVPIAPLTVSAEIVRAGAKVQRSRAVARDDRNTDLARTIRERARQSRGQLQQARG